MIKLLMFHIHLSSRSKVMDVQGIKTKFKNKEQ